MEEQGGGTLPATPAPLPYPSLNLPRELLPWPSCPALPKCYFTMTCAFCRRALARSLKILPLPYHYHHAPLPALHLTCGVEMPLHQACANTPCLPAPNLLHFFPAPLPHYACLSTHRSGASQEESTSHLLGSSLSFFCFLLPSHGNMPVRGCALCLEELPLLLLLPACMHVQLHACCIPHAAAVLHDMCLLLPHIGLDTCVACLCWRWDPRADLLFFYAWVNTQCVASPAPSFSGALSLLSSLLCVSV